MQRFLFQLFLVLHSFLGDTLRNATAAQLNLNQEALLSFETIEEFREYGFGTTPKFEAGFPGQPTLTKRIKKK